MQLTARVVSVLFALYACAASGMFALQSSHLQPIPVEVWRVGDDALTSSLRDAVESAIRTSSDLTLSNGKKPGTLVVTIPRHVNWKRVSGGRTQVTYAAQFSTVNARVIGRTTGSCQDDSLDTCAAQIIKAGRLAARNLR
jgi:hypothetical protein